MAGQQQQQAEEAYMTLLTSDNYLPGVMVLAHSLRDHSTKKKLACMVAMDVLSGHTVNELRTVFDFVIPVDRVRNPAPANLYLMDRPDLDSAFTKINLWQQTQYKKIVYIDADVVALRAPDELFRLEDPFSAAPDIGWPDCFNSGVMVLTPNMGDYYALKALSDRGISFDGADQGLLNMHFRNYNRISFSYNCAPNGNYQYVPAYRHFQSTISLVHFIGREKPWTMGRERGGATGVYQELLGRWWAEYDRHYRVPTTAAISGQAPPSARIVQQHVIGEQQQLSYGYSSLPAPTPTIQVHEPSPNAQPGHQGDQTLPPPEEPMNESSQDANYAGEPQAIEAPPVTEERRFSAPHAEWDPARQAPPPDAKPEAANFPSQTYTMSASQDLWQPPSSYPEPPKDMYYKVPEKREVEVKPRAIFPWEKDKPKPTRVFVEERIPSPPPPPPPPPPTAAADSAPTTATHPKSGSLVSLEDEFSVSPPKEESPQDQSISSTSATSGASTATQTTFSPTTVPFSEYRGFNAWDEDEGINRYVASLQSRRKAGIQVLLSQKLSELSVKSPEERRGSLKITEFPTEVERPSLPVTPAPIRRHMFWESERDAQGNLPEAEGVPGQMEWNPEQQLDTLRRNSLLFANASPNPSTQVPQRTHPESSRKIIASSSNEVAESMQSTTVGESSEETISTYSISNSTTVSSSSTTRVTPSFQSVDFNNPSNSTSTAQDEIEKDPIMQ